jgi:hypothetical protein
MCLDQNKEHAMRYNWKVYGFDPDDDPDLTDPEDPPDTDPNDLGNENE